VVKDFPLLEWTKRRIAFTHAPSVHLAKREDIALLDTNLGKVRANAYDMVIKRNGSLAGVRSVYTIAPAAAYVQQAGLHGIRSEEAVWLPHGRFRIRSTAPIGGIAFGFDRLCSLFGGADSIRDFIAFPKNNAGRDTMIDTPSTIRKEQLR